MSLAITSALGLLASRTGKQFPSLQPPGRLGGAWFASMVRKLCLTFTMSLATDNQSAPFVSR